MEGAIGEIEKEGMEEDVTEGYVQVKKTERD